MQLFVKTEETALGVAGVVRNMYPGSLVEVKQDSSQEGFSFVVEIPEKLKNYVCIILSVSWAVLNTNFEYRMEDNDGVC